MFTKCTLTNFRCFKKATIDFTKSNTSHEQLMAIYGENASGKSSVIAAFQLVKDLVTQSPIAQADTLIRLGSKENTNLTYHFKLNALEGWYQVQFDTKGHLVKEWIHYTKKGTPFELCVRLEPTTRTVYIEHNQTQTMHETFAQQINQRWGGTIYTNVITLLSLIASHKQSVFEDKQIAQDIGVICHFFKQIRLWTENEPFPDAMTLMQGKMETNSQQQLIEMSDQLTDYLAAMDSSIKRAHYSFKDNVNEQTYQLYLTKQIAEEIIDVPAYTAGKGTQTLIALFALTEAIKQGHTVIIDELDRGIHSMLLPLCLKSLQQALRTNSQCLFSTHRTALLNELPKQALYFINVDPKGNRAIFCADNLQDPPIDKEHAYLSGFYGAVPYPLESFFD